MSLKRSHRPEYRVQLPVTNKRLNYSSFTMRTERTLMLATMGGDADEITNAAINCINDHIGSSTVKAEDLPQVEAELLLLLMRAKSVGETIDVNVTDPLDETANYPVKIDLTDITVDVDPEFKSTIQLKSGEIIEFRLPGLRRLEGLNPDLNEFDQSVEIIGRCINTIAIEEEVYAKSDLQMSELKDFILDLDPGDFKVIADSFLSRMPKLSHTVNVEREDGSSFEAEITGLASFL